MSTLTHKGSAVAASLALAFTGVAGTAAAATHHPAHWSAKRCERQLKRWRKAHKHATARQIKAENKLLKKHRCTITAS